MTAILILRSSATDLGAANGFTIAAWLQPAANRWAMWIGWSDDEQASYGPYSYVAGRGPGTIYFNLVDTGGAGHEITSPLDVFVPGEMQHVTLTYDNLGGEAVIYRNGQVVARENLGSFTPATDRRLILGRQPPNWAYDGLMDELMFFERALPANEVGAIVAAGSAGICKSPRILGELRPLSQTRAVGGRAVFRLTTAGAASFQWRHDGIPFATRNTDSLVLTNIQPSHAGIYDVVVRGDSPPAASSRTVRLNVVNRGPIHPCLAAWWAGRRR